MSEVRILDEVPLGSVDLSERLEKIKKRDKELGTFGMKTQEYLNLFVKLKPKEAETLKKKLEGLEIPRLKDRHIIKVIDIMPKDMDSLRALFSGENITVKPEDLKRIMDTLDAKA